jgi:hypothetical protein
MVKNNKEKVFELRIEEDDDVSGIDSISLVDEPAIEVNWVAFKKEVQEDFHIPDNEDQIYLDKLIGIGLDEQSLLDEGYVVKSITKYNQNEFISSTPNDKSSLDGEYLIRYKYIKNPDATGNDIISTTRNFCKDLVTRNLVFRLEDLQGLNNNQGSSAITWRGGYNCRHVWSRIEYYKDTTIRNNASSNKGKREQGGFPTDMDPDEYIPGQDQRDTRTSNPSFRIIEKFEVGVPHYTKDGKLYEGPYHKDANGRLMTGKVHNEDSEYLYHQDELGYENSLPSYVEELPKKKKKGFIEQFEYLLTEEFEGYNDYPSSVKNNAQSVLDWVEENGWGSCGTEVGKIRANQLAKGENISMDTIKRMYSYLSRHEVDLDSSKSYEEGCGRLMYNSWGGKSALSWSKSKINQVENMSKQHFVTDNDKHVVLGPAMVPDMKIPRKDDNGNLYYVYFSMETIAMIAEKYIKNKFTDNNDYMHDGTALKDVYVIESWIKEDEHDKSNKYGFQDLPVGTWFVSMKVNNPEIWSEIKSGKLQGFSVSGFFEQVESFHREEVFLKQLEQLLRKIPD